MSVFLTARARQSPVSRMCDDQHHRTEAQCATACRGGQACRLHRLDRDLYTRAREGWPLCVGAPALQPNLPRSRREPGRREAAGRTFRSEARTYGREAPSRNDDFCIYHFTRPENLPLRRALRLVEDARRRSVHGDQLVARRPARGGPRALTQRLGASGAAFKLKPGAMRRCV